MRRLLDGLLSLAVLLPAIPARRALCWPCMAAGLGLLGWAATSSAADGGLIQDSPIYWFDVGKGAVGIVVVLIGAYMANIDSRVRKNSEALLQNYLTKEETRQMVEDVIRPVQQRADLIGHEVRAVHRRLDQLKVPHAST